MISPGTNRPANQSESRMRCRRVRSSRSSIRLTAALRTPKLAMAAITPTFTSRVMSWSCTGAHYNWGSACFFMNTPFGFEVVKVAEADFPSEYGLFRIYGFEGHFSKPDGSEAVEEAAVLVMGDPTAEAAGMPAPLLRIHSQCLT